MKPRLTQKVLRGLQQLAGNARASGITVPEESELGRALAWVNARSTYRPQRGAMPEHLRKLFKKRRTRRR